MAGVGVVEHDSLRAELLDVAADGEHLGDGAQGAEDARGAARVADVDIDAVLLRDQDVVLPDVQFTAEDGGKDGIGVLEGLAAVGGGRERRRVLTGRDDALARLLCHAQTLAVDVHQDDMGVLHGGEGETVAHQTTGEPQAAGADEHDFCGHKYPFRLPETEWLE